MNLVIAGLIIALAAAPAHACLGPEIIFIPILALGLSLLLLFVGKRLRDADQPVFSERDDRGILIFTLPFPLYASAISIASTGNPGGAWQCTFSNSIGGQIAFHIVLPLVFALAFLFGYSRMKHKESPPFRIVCLWVHIGLWGAALATAIAFLTNHNAGPLFWRAMHYGNTALIFLSVLAAGKLGARGVSAAGLVFTFFGYLLLGLMTTVLFKIF